MYSIAYYRNTGVYNVWSISDGTVLSHVLSYQDNTGEGGELGEQSYSTGMITKMKD